MNSDFLVISNNPLVWDVVVTVKCVRIQDGPLRVFYRGLNFLGEGSHIFYAHPVAGNERLLKNPFRSTVLQKAPPINARDGAFYAKHRWQMKQLEGYLRKLEDTRLEQISPEQRRDYQIVDYELFLKSNGIPEILSGD